MMHAHLPTDPSVLAAVTQLPCGCEVDSSNPTCPDGHDQDVPDHITWRKTRG